MIFETVAPREALGTRLAHSVAVKGGRLRKGAPLDEAAVAALEAAGVARVATARLEQDDIGEDEAADLLGAALAGANVVVEAAFTGRCNLFASVAGVFTTQSERVDAFNAVDEAVTVATLPEFQAVAAGDMVATVKIIPFAAPRGAVEAAARAAAGAISVVAFQPLRVGLIATMTPGLKVSVADKTARVLRERLIPTGAELSEERRVTHDAAAVAEALSALAPRNDLVIIFGASAIADRRDVIPAGLEAAGGVVERLGMPVDPGNLLMLGRLGTTPVLGAPGCARSPRENGFDWILRRLLAGLPITSGDIKRMGVGGLLSEIASRPQPRGGAGATSGDDDER
jgi:molybdenum cofactor cytidylyltransferase